MSCCSCGGEYCDGEKCEENGGQDPFPDPVENDEDWGDDEEDDENLDDDDSDFDDDDDFDDDED